MTRQFEKEFFGLARDWLLCRLFVMGGTCPAKSHHYTLHEWIIGMHSYAGEMELLVEKEKSIYGNDRRGSHLQLDGAEAD